MRPKDADIMAKTVGPGQTAPGATLFVQTCMKKIIMALCYSGCEGESEEGDREGSPGCPDPQLQTHECWHHDGEQESAEGGQVVRQT